MTNLLLISDAASPQINGVVRTLDATTRVLRDRGWAVRSITPSGFRTMDCPGYPNLPLALPPYAMAEHIWQAPFDAVHIATEGPLGWAARRALMRRNTPFTTAYHTNYPMLLNKAFRLPERWSYAALRRFHRPAGTVMVPTISVADTLRGRGFESVSVWSRGVDAGLFHPRPRPAVGLPRPIWLNVGRVSVEKGLRDFLDLRLPGSKVIVGEGPILNDLKAAYPEVHFLGAQTGEALARSYAMADVFVFPSRFDTFGLVMAEAIAMGIPIAAYPVTGPIDVVQHGITGWLDDDLHTACLNAADLDRGRIADAGKAFSWEAATDQFVTNLRFV